MKSNESALKITQLSVWVSKLNTFCAQSIILFGLSLILYDIWLLGALPTEKSSENGMFLKNPNFLYITFSWTVIKSSELNDLPTIILHSISHSIFLSELIGTVNVLNALFGWETNVPSGNSLSENKITHLIINGLWTLKIIQAESGIVDGIISTLTLLGTTVESSVVSLFSRFYCIIL